MIAVKIGILIGFGMIIITLLLIKVSRWIINKIDK